MFRLLPCLAYCEQRCYELSLVFSITAIIRGWGGISLWFWFAFFWWLVMFSTFSYTCWPSVCLLWECVLLWTAQSVPQTVPNVPWGAQLPSNENCCSRSFLHTAFPNSVSILRTSLTSIPIRWSCMFLNTSWMETQTVSLHSLMWVIELFKNLLICLAVLSLSCSTQDLCCIMWDLLLWCANSSCGTWTPEYLGSADAVRAHSGAGGPLREEHLETCPHLSQFPSGPADVITHHQGQRGEYGSHSILVMGAGIANLGETV